MDSDAKAPMQRAASLLTRLARNTAGNTMAIMAAALFPLAGMIGGALDLSRLYLIQTRLQHACDAGALAGRKAMGGGRWTQSGNRPAITATEFFNANIQPNAYGAENIASTFTEDAGKVQGTATAEVPMTLMRVFGMDMRELSVTCDAEMRLPNTDVMFVLDVTGSMDVPIPGDSQRKIDGLNVAVKCFYEILMRLDTDAACEGGAPSGGIGDETQVRFGFVPYATNVNVGRLLRPDWMVDEWTYQSREVVTVWGMPTGTYSDADPGDWSGWTNRQTTTLTRQLCEALADPKIVKSARTSTYGRGKNDPDTGLALNSAFKADQNWQDTETDYTSWTLGINGCKYRTRTRNFTRTYDFRVVAEGTPGATAFNAWNYAPVEFNVSGLKNGATWRNAITLRVGNNYANRSITWNGCIEERQTVRASTYLPLDPAALDLDIDAIPTTDEDTRWKPLLPNVTFQRRDELDGGNRSTQPIKTFRDSAFSGGSYSCPPEASRLVEWANPDTFEAYVDTLVPTTNTYHDIGLIWGARLMSPTGLFAADNRFTPEGGEIERHLIFMTDGEACTSVGNYQAYGIGWYDRRQTDLAVAPSDGCSTTGTLTQQVNARTAAICSEVKRRNITLWVIWFGTANATIEGQLSACASPSRFFSARSSAQLQQTFADIANQISQLRLTQ